MRCDARVGRFCASCARGIRTSLYSKKVQDELFNSILIPQAISNPEHVERDGGEHHQKSEHDGKTEPRGYVGMAEEPVTKSVDRIEERIEVRDGAPELGKAMQRIKNAAQKGQRQNDEVLKSGELVELNRPDAGD